MSVLQPLPFEEIKAAVKKRLTAERFGHTLGVVRTAEELAALYGADVQKARLAGVLHDIAKGYSKNRLLKEALDFGIVLSDIERSAPALIHAPLGAEIAKREFGIGDADVLAAIRHHTTGRAGMSVLEQVVFLADCIEPGRTYPGVDEVRAGARIDLNSAVLGALNQSLMFLLQRNRLIHPHAVAARNELLMRRG